MATENTREREREAAIKKAKRNKRKRKIKNRIIITILSVLIVVTTLITLSLTVFFNLKEIIVSGNTVYSADEIIDSAEIAEGDNLFRISGNKISTEIEESLPYVKSVEIERVLPDALKLIITETKDEICIVKGNELYTADLSGKILSKTDVYDEKLIKVKVSSDAKISVGKNIEFKTEREAELFDMLFAAITDNDWDVDAVDISDPYAGRIRYEDRLIVEFGSTIYFEQKISYFNAGIKNISNDAVGIFDLSEWSPENNAPVLRQQDISEYNF